MTVEEHEVSEEHPVVESPLARFRRSMVIDYEKWHDGVGYDLDALREARGPDHAAIEELLIARGAQDWRDVEALASIDTPRARQVLRRALEQGNAEVRTAVLRHAPTLVSDEERTAALVAAIGSAEAFAGLSTTLDEVAQHHPPEVVDALFRATLTRPGEVAVHFAAMLTFLHGKAAEPFDFEQRPFFLRFQTEVVKERRGVFRELCLKVGVSPGKYLAPPEAASGAKRK